MQFTHQIFIKPKWKEQTVHYCWSVSQLLLFEAILTLGVQKWQREKGDKKNASKIRQHVHVTSL